MVLAGKMVRSFPEYFDDTQKVEVINETLREVGNDLPWEIDYDTLDRISNLRPKRQRETIH